MDWDNYRAFLEVYRCGDLGHAALGLEMSVPTVRRRLDAVESHIGFPLFERTPRGLSPTPVARRLVHSIAAMGDFAAVAGSLKEGPAQSATIAADDSIAYFIADAGWADLRRSQPGLGVTVLTRRRPSEVCDVRADAAISHVRPKAAAARCLGALDIGLFAHRDYLSRAGIPESAAELERFCMVAPEADEARTWLEIRLGLPADCARSVFRTDSYAGQIAAMEAGAGIGACYVGLAKGRPDLARVLPEVAGRLDCWLWSLRSQTRNGAASLVFDALAATFSEHIGPGGCGRTIRPDLTPLKTLAA